MPLTTDEIEAIALALATKGVKSLQIGDRRIDYLSPKDAQDLLNLKNALDNDKDGGIYKVEFTRE
jgi:hypothetical protein